MAIYKDISNEEVDARTREEVTPITKEVPLLDQTSEEPQISFHALTSISSPQTLKSVSYIKQWKVIVLIENDNTHNFVHHLISQETHFYIHVVNNF
jgi:hypothetical protein